MAGNQSTRLQSGSGELDFLKDQHTRVVLEDAAKTFVQHTDDTVEIWAASRDWFLEEWGRDTFISLPGLLLTTKRYDEAKQVFLHFAKFEHSGLIPNIVRGENSIYNTSDASLLFIYALKRFADATGDWQFVATMMPTVRSIISAYTDGTGYDHAGSQHKIVMDAGDGLLMIPAQSTWMDADPSGDGTTIVTPRNGKCVEINALWYAALRFTVNAERTLNGSADMSELEMVSDRVRTSYAGKFWNAETGCLFDVIEGDPHGPAIRPNQVLAISHGEDLLEPEKQRQVLNVVTRELLTPGGLRTLSPHDPQYLGHYDTAAPIAIKDLAYHQGTVWPWLIGPYCDAVRTVRTQQGVNLDEIERDIGGAISPLVRFCLDSEFKSLPEVFSGDPPHEPGGTSSQAWSIAEVLRIFSELSLTN